MFLPRFALRACFARVDEDVIAWMKVAAEVNGRTFAGEVEEAMRLYLRQPDLAHKLDRILERRRHVLKVG